MLKSLFFTCLCICTAITAIAQNESFPLAWAHGFGSDRWEAATSLEADNSGNIVVAGFFSGSADFDPGPEEFILSPSGVDDQSNFSNFTGFIQKLDGDGNLLWAIKHLEGNFPSCCWQEQTTRVYIAPNDDIFVLSNVKNNIDLDPGPGSITLGEETFNTWVIQKFDANGQLIWVKSTNMPEYLGKATALDIDSNGDFVLGGVYNGFYCTNLGSGCFPVAPTNSEGDLPFVSKLNGDTGDLIWTRVFEWPSASINQMTIDSDLYDVAIDPSTGNVAIAGWFMNSLQYSPGQVWFNQPQVNSTKNGFVITLDAASGQNIWEDHFPAPFDGVDGYIQDIEFDGSSRLYARGVFPEPDFSGGSLTKIFDSQGLLLHNVLQDPAVGRERNTILHVNSDGSFMLSGMQADNPQGRLRHQANVYNSAWELEHEYEITGQFYIYALPWAQACMDEGGAVYFAGGFNNEDYDAHPDPNIEVTLPITPCAYTVCSDWFVQKVDPCSGSSSVENVNLCSGSEYTFPDGEVISNVQSNFSYVSNLGEVDGCTNTITTNILVQESYSSVLDVYLCPGETYTFPDGTSQTFFESTSQNLMYTNSFGCDSTITTNVTVELVPDVSASYDCTNEELVVDVSSMGTYLGEASPAWDILALSVGEQFTVSNTGQYSIAGANANQSHRLALFEPNNCAADIFIIPNCSVPPCGEEASEQIPNGNFDSENDNSWTQTSTSLDGTTATGYSVIDGVNIYDNSVSAWFGGFNGGSVTSIEQDVYIPASTEITELTWWQNYSGTCQPEDVFTIQLGSQIIYSQSSDLETTCGNPNWHRKSIDISSFASGSTLHLTMTYTQSGANGFSSLFVDNVSILSCECETGCTDPSACNFDPMAQCDDGSCCNCAADFNLDGTTNSTDLIILIETYGCSTDCGPTDLNADGAVSSTDVIIFLNTYGTSCF